MRKLVLGLAIGLLALSPGWAQGDTVLVAFSGTVSSLSSAVLFPFQQIGVEVGTPASGSFAFDASTLDSVPEDPTVGRYEGALRSWNLQVGPWIASNVDVSACGGQGNFVTNQPSLWNSPGLMDSFLMPPTQRSAPSARTRSA